LYINAACRDLRDWFVIRDTVAGVDRFIRALYVASRSSPN
jgi:hypothetical protein